LLGRTAGSVRRSGEKVQEGLPDLEDDEQPGEGFAVNPGKEAYGGSLDDYKKSLDRWPEPLARKSTAESVSGQFFQEWAKDPDGSLPVAVAPDSVVTSAGLNTKVVAATPDTLQVMVSSEVITDLSKVQSVLDAGTWDMTDNGWLITQGDSLVEVVQDGIGAPMDIVRIDLQGASS
jgi:hypothetical protein